MGILFFQPSMVSAPCAGSQAHSSSLTGPLSGARRTSSLTLLGWPLCAGGCSAGLGCRGRSQAHRGRAGSPTLASNSLAAPGGSGQAGQAGLPGLQKQPLSPRGPEARPGQGRDACRPRAGDCRAPEGWAPEGGVGSCHRPVLIFKVIIMCSNSLQILIFRVCLFFQEF